MIKGKVIDWQHVHPFLYGGDVREGDGIKFNPYGECVVRKSFAINVSIANKGLRHEQEILIPKGFICDGSSTPFRGAESSKLAGTVHDYVYRNPDIPLTRKQADKLLFFILLEHQQFTLWRAWRWWLAVRLFGAGNYKKRSKTAA